MYNAGNLLKDRSLKKILYYILIILFSHSIIAEENNADQLVSYNISLAGRVIVELEFQGLKKTRRDFLLGLIQSQEGSIYDPTVLEIDIQTLKNLRLFLDVESEVVEVDQGVKVIIHAQDVWSFIPFIIPGYDSSRGFSLSGGVMDSNFQGRGNTLIINTFILVDEASIQDWGLMLVETLRSRKDSDRKYIFGVFFVNEDLAQKYAAFYGTEQKIDDYISVSARFQVALSYKLNEEEQIVGPILGISGDSMKYSQRGMRLEGHKWELKNKSFLVHDSIFLFRDLFESKFITGLYLGDRINLLSSIRYQFIFNDTEEWGGEPNIRGFNKDDISGHQILLLNQELRAEFFYKEDIGRVALTAFWDGAGARAVFVFGALYAFFSAVREFLSFLFWSAESP